MGGNPRTRHSLRSWRCFLTTHLHDGLETSPFASNYHPRVGTRIPRNASTVLSATGFTKGTRKAPHVTRVFPLGQENLGSPQAPIWHSGGLLPETLTRATRVLLPCLSLPPGMWGICQLSLDEILYSLNFNDVSVTAFEPFGSWFTELHLGQLNPLKSLEEMFNSYLIKKGLDAVHALNVDFTPVFQRAVTSFAVENINGGGVLLLLLVYWSTDSNASLFTVGLGKRPAKHRCAEAETDQARTGKQAKTGADDKVAESTADVRTETDQDTPGTTDNVAGETEDKARPVYILYWCNTSAD
jgi:hypothetical protein